MTDREDSLTGNKAAEASGGFWFKLFLTGCPAFYIKDSGVIIVNRVINS